MLDKKGKQISPRILNEPLRSFIFLSLCITIALFFSFTIISSLLQFHYHCHSFLLLLAPFARREQTRDFRPISCKRKPTAQSRGTGGSTVSCTVRWAAAAPAPCARPALRQHMNPPAVTRKMKRRGEKRNTRPRRTRLWREQNKMAR